ncbi:MAG: glycine cleavage T C-terminal barrel domain-containing protein, partial [Burkholderiales bacterium]
TSGPLSSSLTGRNCGLGYVATEDAGIGTDLEIDIRGKRSRGRVVATPFSPRRVKEEPRIRTWSPYQLRFIESHVWAGLEAGAKDVVVIGITDFGQRSLGDILSATLPKVGDRVAGDSALGWVDFYRRAFDVVSPVSGEVIEVNPDVAADPAHINAYPYSREGVLKVRVKSLRDYEEMLTFEAYADLTRRLQRYDEWTKERRLT